ncbi:hypothetical protein [Psychroflexus salis]|uniref:hypothetical protein n=1 Tax=Psychroflexus salis TaxID=1526574 RepID=UPI001E2868C7|nr:hypothetical protein [Psychroflexus salis]
MRISLDQLNTRNKEQVFINACFSVQQRFVVDNTNPTKEERSNTLQPLKRISTKLLGIISRPILMMRSIEIVSE